MPLRTNQYVDPAPAATTAQTSGQRRVTGGGPGVTGQPGGGGSAVGRRPRPATGGAQPAGTGTAGTSTFRRNMPRGAGVGGVNGPTTMAGSSAKAPGATLSGAPATPTFGPSIPSVTPKGGGTETALPKPNPGAGGVARPMVPNPGSPAYGGFNPAQLVQQNGQWGGVGQGGGFQALGGPALAQWLQAQSQIPGALGPTPVGPASPPSGPPMAAGYVTADQFANPMYDWFRNSQPAGANDWNSFNQWFRQHGQQYDPTGWANLYGSNAMTGNPNAGNAGLIYSGTG